MPWMLRAVGIESIASRSNTWVWTAVVVPTTGDSPVTVTVSSTVPRPDRFYLYFVAWILIRFSVPTSGGSSVVPDGHAFVFRMNAMTSTFC